MNSQVDREKCWIDICRQLRADPPDPRLRVLVLAAHPDDETIGASTLLARFPQSAVAYLTDGTPRDPRLWSGGVHRSRDDYARLRQQEALRALGCAGVPEQRIFWLGGVDQESAFEIAGLAEKFANLLNEFRPTAIVTHPYEGGHPDHDSAAVVARIALSQIAGRHTPILLEMTSYHAHNEKCVTGEFLNSSSTPEFVFNLLETDRERKRKMLDAYASQRLVLGNFPITQERFRLAPEYDVSRPPHEGKLWYECMGWPMTGTRWRELAVAALAKSQGRSQAEVQEHSCR